jgi:peptidoglycan/xylan/chitin deacetylase (PgdA/CDA1 family)
MTWEMLAAMRRAGVTVGSHTRTHAWLTQEAPARVAEELRGSRLAIEERLGGSVDHFAYPDGRFTRATVQAVADAGYRFGYTTCTDRDGRHPLLTMPRHMLWQNSSIDAVGRFSPVVMSSHVHGVFALVRGCGQEHAR